MIVNLTRRESLPVPVKQSNGPRKEAGIQSAGVLGFHVQVLSGNGEHKLVFSKVTSSVEKHLVTSSCRFSFVFTSALHWFHGKMVWSDTWSNFLSLWGVWRWPSLWFYLFCLWFFVFCNQEEAKNPVSRGQYFYSSPNKQTNKQQTNRQTEMIWSLLSFLLSHWDSQIGHFQWLWPADINNGNQVIDWVASVPIDQICDSTLV